jgi:2-C-methyl-D-erythritol 4-phosphate cytidylyltransferase
MVFSVIILAAGSGRRSGLNYNKVLYEINRKKVLDYSLDFFEKFDQVKDIIIVASEADLSSIKSMYSKMNYKIILGGKSRQESVYRGLQEVDSDFVFIHDGARPNIPLEPVLEMIKYLQSYDSVTLGVPVKDTIKLVQHDVVQGDLKRQDLMAIQTPQVFRTSVIVKAHNKAIETGFVATDDTSLCDQMLHTSTYVVLGDYDNIKLTTNSDIRLLEVLL